MLRNVTKRKQNCEREFDQNAIFIIVLAIEKFFTFLYDFSNKKLMKSKTVHGNGHILNTTKNEIFLYDRKLKKNSCTNVWFFFPGPESFAMSSLGYLWLFKELDEQDNIDVERVYADSKTTRIMRDKIDAVGISISFDMDFLAIFEFLEKNKFNFKTHERNESDPFIFAGGPVITSNPAPYKEFFDFMIIGDGEGVNTEAINTIEKLKAQGKTKSEVLQCLSKLEGVYVPDCHKSVVKRTQKLSQCIYTPIISDKSFFPDTFIIEVERGCANRCGFCIASYINLPIRFADYDEIISNIEAGLKVTNKIALLGAQVTAHPKFYDICKYIENKIDNGQNIQMSISSLRIDAFTPEIVNILVKAGQNSLTLAIEAGSERLRRFVNKNITEEQIMAAIDTAVTGGLKGIKIYGMLGIPTETKEDIDEIIRLAKQIKAKYKGFSLSFGFSTFVPKANTPFQWFGRDNEKSLSDKEKYLRKELHKIGVQINVSSPKWDYYQAVLSRGDEKLSDYMIHVYKGGGKIGAFRKTAKDLNINTDYYAAENYDETKPLPWDFIDIKPGKEFLINEKNRLMNYSGR